MAVWFSNLLRTRKAINRKNHTAKSGCATFSAVFSLSAFPILAKHKTRQARELV